MRKILHLVIGIMFIFLLIGCNRQDINKDTYIQTYYENYMTYLNKVEALETFAFKHAVKIIVEASETKTIFGSGVIFKTEGQKTYVLTNYHLVYDDRNHQNMYILNHVEERYQVTFVYGNASYDLAILVFEQNTDTYTNIKILDTQVATPYGTYLSGYPQGENYQMMYGNFTNLKKINLKGDVGEIIQVTFNVMSIRIKSESGSSGSGVYDLNANLIGLVFAGNNIPNDLSETYVIPSIEIINFLIEYDLQKTT
jgi:S1-C subfamily serine protease